MRWYSIEAVPRRTATTRETKQEPGDRLMQCTGTKVMCKAKIAATEKKLKKVVDNEKKLKKVVDKKKAAW